MASRDTAATLWRSGFGLQVQFKSRSKQKGNEYVANRSIEAGRTQYLPSRGNGNRLVLCYGCRFSDGSLAHRWCFLGRANQQLQFRGNIGAIGGRGRSQRILVGVGSFRCELNGRAGPARMVAGNRPIQIDELTQLIVRRNAIGGSGGNATEGLIAVEFGDSPLSIGIPPAIHAHVGNRGRVGMVESRGHAGSGEVDEAEGDGHLIDGAKFDA